MKKALQITIAGVLFTIEEDAYAKLDAYLRSIQGYFGEEGQEVVQDIEARIAERLSEELPERAVVSLREVDGVVAVMGTVEEITGGQPARFEGPRKLYRDPDDIVVAGVASGLAAYFSVDPLVVRLVFLILVLATSGAMVFVYLVAALLIPKASTPADKAGMRGGPLTLGSFRSAAGSLRREGAAAEGGSPFRRAVEALFRMLGMTVRTGVRLLSKAAGALLIAAALAGTVGTLFAVANLTFNLDTPYVQVPAFEAVPEPAHYVFLLLGAVLALVPLFLIAAFGRFLIVWRKAVSWRSVAVLMAVWIVAGLTMGTLAVRYGERMKAAIESTRSNYESEQGAVAVEELAGEAELVHPLE